MRSINPLFTICALAISSISYSVCAQTNDNTPKSVIYYANEYKVSITEARRRLDFQRIVGKLKSRLEKEQAETFGGIFIEHSPAFHVTVKFTRDGKSTLARYISNPDISASTSSQTYKSLLSAQSASYRLLKGKGYESVSFIDVKSGQVKFFLDNPSTAQQSMSKITSTGAPSLKLPSFVIIGKATNLSSKRESTVEGGRPLSGGDCTSGFTVYDGTQGRFGPRYLSTAGHCSNTLTYNGVDLPLVGENYEANTNNDFQWHSAPGFETLQSDIYVGSVNKMRVDRVLSSDEIAVGNFFCKYGSSTLFTCGSVSSTSYNQLGSPGFILVHNDANTNLSDPGDSGAPWFDDENNAAVGSHSDSSRQNANDAVFMPIENISASNLVVLLTPPS